MSLKNSYIITGVFCLTVCALSFFTAINYPGNALIYIIFSILLNTLFVIGFTKKRIFFDTFIGIFFWLGYWMKFSVRVAFFGGRFHEPVGNFDGTGAAFDHALLVTSCGVAALLIASFIRRKSFFSYENIAGKTRFEGIFLFYEAHRRAVLILFSLVILIVSVTNVIFGFYQRGSVPRAILPFKLNGVYTWLLLFGMASISAVILDCEFRLKSNPYLASIISLFECLFSNMSMLSRGMILNGGALMIGVSDNSEKRSIRLKFAYKLIIIVLFGTMFLSSVLSVNHLRRYIFSASDISGISAVKVTADSFAYTASTSWLLFIDRWVGAEGVMAVSSYPHLGWDLWKRAWQEKFSNYGTSMYDREFIESPYLKMDWSKHHFVGVPGILAFFYYPGSYSFLFVSMFFLGLLAAGIEFFIYRFSGANIILCSLLAQAVASRYAHFGYAPNQSYLLFGSIFLNVLIIFFFDKFMLFLKRNVN